MNPILMEGTAEPVVNSISGVLDWLSSIISLIITTLGSLYTTITETPLLFIPVVVGFAGALIFTTLGVLKRLGVARGGKRRRGRR